MLLNRRCPRCGVPSRALCEPCWAGRTPPPSPLVVPGLEDVQALCAYDPSVKKLVLAAKNHHRKDLLGSFGVKMADLVSFSGQSAQLVTWVPASIEQTRVRGFDQGQLLARRVGRALGLPAVCVLKRLNGAKQVGKDRNTRLLGPELRRGPRRVPSRVLVVDDVMTTGGSLAAAASVLRSAGAQEIRAVVIAAKP